MASQVDYRKCVEADANVLCVMGVYTFRDTFAASTAENDMVAYLTEAFARDQVVAELNDVDSMFYLATVDGTPAGYMKLNVGEAQTEHMGDSCLEVQRLYVLPEYKRHRIGTGLMHLAFDKARRLGKRRMWLGVWEHNEPAKAFYLGMGYSFFSTHTFQVGDDPQTDLLMLRATPDASEL